jgi:hypothetical protein
LHPCLHLLLQFNQRITRPPPKSKKSNKTGAQHNSCDRKQSARASIMSLVKQITTHILGNPNLYY